jgi:multiple sugar transport system ATP-binding protein
MAGIALERVTKTFRSKRGEVRAVDDLTLTVADGELVVLVGPSGCGKTTTLRLIAGLEEITSGAIRIGDRVVNDVAPRDRDIAMVFQHYALYPHMTVFRNMAFGLKMHGMPKGEIDRKVNEVARTLGLERLLGVKPAALSGGERQRVALGRAIVRKPQVFLLDEPLSNLDAGLRIKMRTRIKSLHRQLGATMIYVTHDQAEAMTLGDRIVVLKDGAVQQCGAAMEIYDRPANRFVGSFMGTPPMNLLEGRLEEAGETVCFCGPAGRFEWPPATGKGLKAHCDKGVVLGIRPEDVRLDHSAPVEPGGGVSKRQEGCATVGEMSVGLVEPMGDTTVVHLAAERGENLIARVPPTLMLRSGQRVRPVLDLSRAHLFAADKRGERLV